MMKKYLLFLLATGFIAFTGCQKELSFELPNTPAEGSLQDDASGDCLPKTVNGAYGVGQALTNSNSITIAVNVTRTGTYAIGTDTVNGYYFRGTGSFTTLGVNNVTLRGNGTPFAQGTNNFVVTFDSTVCDIQIPVTQPGVGNLAGSPNACAPITVSGSYSPGMNLNASHFATVQVNVTTPGAFSITTDTINGVWFTFSGNLGNTPPAQSVNLQANGKFHDTTTGTKIFTVKLGTSRCTFPVAVVAPATGTVNCTGATPAGTYTVGAALVPGTNTVQISFNVLTAGAYTISTDTVHGMYFNASGTFPTAPATVNVTLAGNGVPDAAGTWTLTVKYGTSTCTFNVVVQPAATGGACVPDCSTAIPNGLYETTLQLNCSNTVDITVNVTSLGAFSVNTTPVNGMTFSWSGTFTTLGPQTITLVGSGTPGATATTSNITFPGSPSCTFPIVVDPPFGPYGWTLNATTAPAVTYKGQFDFGEIIPAPAPATGIIYRFEGSNSVLSDFFQFGLNDANGTIVVGETYSTSVIPPAGNSAAAQYDLPGGPGCTNTYSANPTVSGVTLVFTVTFHDAVNSIIRGTFTGRMKNLAGNNIDVNGTFDGLY